MAKSGGWNFFNQLAKAELQLIFLMSLGQSILFCPFPSA